MPKFIELISFENCRTIKNLSIFIDKAFKRREDVGTIYYLTHGINEMHIIKKRT